MKVNLSDFQDGEWHPRRRRGEFDFREEVPEWERRERKKKAKPWKEKKRKRNR